MNRKLLIVLIPLILTIGGCSQGTEAPKEPVIAKIDVTPVIVADMETPISAAESTGDPSQELTYEYDVDGDGVFESKGSENFPATLYHTFPGPGDQKVSVKVSDSTGQSSVATKEFTVYPSDFLSIDKKAVLPSNVSMSGNIATIKTFVDEGTFLSLKVYALGKTSLNAQAEEIKDYGSWAAVVPDLEDVKTINFEGFPAGEYHGTISSSTGAEKELTFIIS